MRSLHHSFRLRVHHAVRTWLFSQECFLLLTFFDVAVCGLFILPWTSLFVFLVGFTRDAFLTNDVNVACAEKA